MKFRSLRAWWSDETGAVTVDWVVLTAFVVSLGFVVAGLLGGPTQEHANKLGDKMITAGIMEY